MRYPVMWILAALLLSGCDRRDRTAEAQRLREYLTGPRNPAVSEDVWKDVRDAYGRRDNTPAWIADGLERATGALEVIRSASLHGLQPADYGDAEIAALLTRLQDGSGDAGQLGALDGLVTSALLGLGRDVAVGRRTPESIDPRWKRQRDVPDLVGTLTYASTGDLRAWLDSVAPRHREYALLQDALEALRAQETAGGWPLVPQFSVRPGGSHPGVAALRQRLAAGGDLAEESASAAPDVYDERIASAVKVFQARHGLPETGQFDARTRAAMNVGVGERIRQVEANLERWRWLPDDLGGRHVLVNVPAYQLTAWDSGRPSLEMRVIVGTPEHETPIFSDGMTTVVFSPYWNVPDSIVEGETAPAAARDPGFLARNNIEILRRSRSGVTRVDPASVNWDDAAQLKELAFRQKPGATNALGHVKFLFPNPYDVYLHDTPADALFARAGRAFSHGCVRVEEPEALATWVLRDHPEWDAPKMKAAMYSGEETPVALKVPIPVHIVYFTAWVDGAGRLRFASDVYGHDAAQLRTTESR